MNNVTKKYGKLKFVTIVFSFAVIGVYVYDWFHYLGVFHPESINDIIMYVRGIRNSGVLRTCFDLATVEGGGYRPRLLAFLIQYYDVEGWILLNRLTEWGGHYPFVLVGIPFLVVGGYCTLNKICGEEYKACNFLIASLFLFEPQYLVTTFLFCRTAKLLTVGFGICVSVFLWKLKLDRGSRLWRYFKEVSASFVISLLCTEDEQLLIIMVVLASIFVIDTFNNKNSWAKVRICFESLVFYEIYYKWWGRILFEKYTTVQIVPHFHTFQGAFAELSENMKYGLFVYCNALKYALFNSRISVIVFVVLFCIILLRCRWKVRLVCLELVISAIVLSGGMVSAHPGIYSIPELSHGMYFIVGIFMTFIAFIYAAVEAKIESSNRFHIKNWGYIFVLTFWIINFVYTNVNMKDISIAFVTHNDVCIIPEKEKGIENVYSDNDIKAMGINEEYFKGLLCSEEEYHQYINR